MRLGQTQTGLALFPTIATAPPPPPPPVALGPFVPVDLSDPPVRRIFTQELSIPPLQRNLPLTAGVLPPAHLINNVSGHWIYVDQGVSKDAQFARMQQLATLVPSCRGFQFLWKWAHLENPNTPGDYSGNWAAAGQAGNQLIKRFADFAASVGKLIHINNFTYGGNVGAPNSAGTGFLSDQEPTYLSGAAYGPNTAASNGIFGGMWQNCYPQTFTNVRSFMRYWVPAVGQRLLALSKNLGDTFDSHPGFGMWSPTSESTLPLSGISFSIAADEAVWLGPNGFFAQMRAQMPHKALRYWANYLDTSNTMSTYLNAAVASKWMVGGPDTLNDPYDAAFNAGTWAPAWNSGTTYRFGQVVARAGVNYFCITGNTNSQPPSGNWSTLGTGTRTVTADQVWQGRNSDNTTNGAYNNWVNRGAWGADVEPLDLDTSHDDGVNFHHVQHANKLGANCLFWYDLRYNSSNSTPSWNRSDSPSPNLLDWIESCARGGNVSINGVIAGIALNNASVYPPTW